MASEIKTKSSPITKSSIEIVDIESVNYCSDCIYDWCSKRSKVQFCTMKSKGFFECKSCMLKLIQR
ncbi:MAG: hypothetical protein FK733_02715 [Asgard group archaeon]|nr:hypothetical protein [Asgard group archaeon]